jgi:DNA-directed RNA polymerase subunit RPC12/RpoP
MCKSKDCQHGKESPIKDWKHRCQFGPDGKKLYNGTVIVGWNDMATTHKALAVECLDDSTRYQAGTRKRLNWKCSICGYEWQAAGDSRVNGRGCACCSNKVVISGINDMATTHPELAKECLNDSTKYTAGTHLMLDWKCSTCGYEWPQTGNSRVNNGSGCPCCSNRVVVPGINDMATTHPELAKECLSDSTKYAAGTNVILDWKCSVCGYEWPATGSRRVRGCGCPCCSNRVVVPGINDMATTHPELAKECLNDSTKYTAGTHVVLDWECSTCGCEWPATGRDRVNNGSGCPSCAPHGHDQTKESFVYLLYRPGQIKYGIMNTWTRRLKHHANNGWELLDKIEVTGQKARSLETTIKQTLRAKGILTGSKAFREKFEGYAETFQEVDLCVRSIRGLCRKLGINLEAFLAA